VSDSHSTRLRDGRDLGWIEIGDPKGHAVFGFHGTPGSRQQLNVDNEYLLSAGVRLVCPDRPGYGLSTFQPSRRLVDWPDDVAQLADHLGIERFGVLGYSGGGPHAIVCAALLPQRVSAGAIVSGVGPLSDPRAVAAMKSFNRLVNRLSQRRSRLVRPLMAAQVELARRWPSWALELLKKQLPPADVRIVDRPDVRALLQDDISHASRTTGMSATQDFEIFANDWGFDLTTITVPLHLWQGDADRNVPPLHAQILHEQIKGSVLHVVPRQGHFMFYDHLDGILASLSEK
jgi:pimeloyl-ACP methyl ester carboxylesterase